MLNRALGYSSLPVSFPFAYTLPLPVAKSPWSHALGRACYKSGFWCRCDEWVEGRAGTKEGGSLLGVLA